MAKTKAHSKAKMKTPAPIEAFEALSNAEKERQYAEFDKEFVPTRPLTPAQRKLWTKARGKRGRPKIGEGAKIVSLSIEGNLLRQADALAKKRRISRSELVAGALRAVLTKAG